MYNRFDIIDFQVIYDKWMANTNSFNVYIHSPFCQSICKFCIYKGLKYNNTLFEQYYNHYLPKVIDMYSNILDTKTNLITSWFFGGGTPSLMTASMADVLFDSLPNFAYHNSEKVFEIHPGAYTVELLDVLKKYNFTTVIICQQTFDIDTLKRQNRTVSGIDTCKKLFKECRKRGFKIGFDIIAFLNQQPTDIQILQNDLDIVSTLKPDEISVQTLYQRKDLTRMVLNSIFNHKLIKHYTPEWADKLSKDDLLVTNQHLKCFRLFNNKTPKNNEFYSFIGNMDPNWQILNNQLQTLAIGSYKNQLTQTHSNIGGFNYFETNFNNIDPVFKFVTNDLEQEKLYVQNVLKEADIVKSVDDIVYSHSFIYAREIPIMLDFSVSNLNEQEVDKIIKKIHNEKRTMLKKFKEN